ncbi:hypothetical protein BJ166DRAFT_532155 [Pestalotiopsis sp. NC0098]|nr:hypothetical protein BJ166DRAFT_532155 [Pestalotiopsis sp. NC0098]
MARTKQTARCSTGGGLGPRLPFGGPHRQAPDVWSIPEVAENILAHLSMKDLLLAQRVSSGWKELIARSPVLQECLFFRPRQSEANRDMSSDAIPARELNPLLVEHMPMWFSTSQNKHYQSVRDAPWAESVARLVFLRRDASWRRMLLAQPPFTVFESVQSVHTRIGDKLSVGCIEQPDGVRMGLAYDKATESVVGGVVAGLPNSFHTLMDGVAIRDADPSGANVTDSEEPVLESDLASSQRVFGGINKFTVFSNTTRGCMKTSSVNAGRRRLMTQRQLMSTGFEDVEIVLRQIDEGTTTDPGPCFSWWTGDGYRESG